MKPDLAAVRQPVVEPINSRVDDTDGAAPSATTPADLALGLLVAHDLLLDGDPLADIALKITAHGGGSEAMIAAAAASGTNVTTADNAHLISLLEADGNTASQTVRHDAVDSDAVHPERQDRSAHAVSNVDLMDHPDVALPHAAGTLPHGDARDWIEDESLTGSFQDAFGDSVDFGDAIHQALSTHASDPIRPSGPVSETTFAGPSVTAPSAAAEGLGTLDTQLAALYLSHASSTAATNDGKSEHSPSVSADGKYVTIDATSKDGDGAALLEQLEAIGLEHGASFGAIAGGRLPVAELGALLGLGDLAFAQESAYSSAAGSVESQGDHAMLADLARTTYGVDGSGIA
ncbi:MAG TPA: hypothetical protein VMT54_05980, partial [Candidatus Cybelea sp.]|nr:hypothetical protein [Candidatus Cybelea sp.]